jgi:hypothetical protein
MPCGTKPMALLTRASSNMAPPSAPMRTRDIDSTPPATTRCSQPERTFIAAVLTASSPDAQKRLSLHPRHVHIPAGVERGRARNVAALLADRRDAAEHNIVNLGRLQVVRC